jgi:hypothetical protein
LRPQIRNLEIGNKEKSSGVMNEANFKNKAVSK